MPIPDMRVSRDFGGAIVRASVESAKQEIRNSIAERTADPERGANSLQGFQAAVRHAKEGISDALRANGGAPLTPTQCRKILQRMHTESGGNAIVRDVLGDLNSIGMTSLAHATLYALLSHQKKFDWGPRTSLGTCRVRLSARPGKPATYVPRDFGREGLYEHNNENYKAEFIKAGLQSQLSHTNPKALSGPEKALAESTQKVLARARELISQRLQSKSGATLTDEDCHSVYLALHREFHDAAALKALTPDSRDLAHERDVHGKLFALLDHFDQFDRSPPPVWGRSYDFATSAPQRGDHAPEPSAPRNDLDGRSTT